MLSLLPNAVPDAHQGVLLAMSGLGINQVPPYIYLHGCILLWAHISSGHRKMDMIMPLLQNMQLVCFCYTAHRWAPW